MSKEEFEILNKEINKNRDFINIIISDLNKLETKFKTFTEETASVVKSLKDMSLYTRPPILTEKKLEEIMKKYELREKKKPKYHNLEELTK